MAEITEGGAGKSADRKIRIKKQSTKIDMTPMVDLAFLLLTFFILTTTFKESYVLRVEMPEEVQDLTKVPKVSEKHVLNLVLAENNRIFWWMGPEPSAQMTNYSNSGVRKILLEKSRADSALVVLIKPKDTSKYENMVDILDEMTVTDMKRYAIVDFTDEDSIMISEN